MSVLENVVSGCPESYVPENSMTSPNWVIPVRDSYINAFLSDYSNGAGISR